MMHCQDFQQSEKYRLPANTESPFIMKNKVLFNYLAYFRNIQHIAYIQHIAAAAEEFDLLSDCEWRAYNFN